MWNSQQILHGLWVPELKVLFCSGVWTRFYTPRLVLNVLFFCSDGLTLFCLLSSGMWTRFHVVWSFFTSDWPPRDKIIDTAIGIFSISGSNMQNQRSQYWQNVIQYPIWSGKIAIWWNFTDFQNNQNVSFLFFFQPLRSVAVDHAEESCYVGSQDGKIYRIDLLDPPRGVEQMVDETASKKMFVGHEKAVTCLSVSTDGCHLLSGKHRKNVKLDHNDIYSFVHWIIKVPMMKVLVYGTWPAANASVF